MVRATVNLGRIAGVKVGINWSALVIVMLIVAGLAGGELPSAYPGRSAVIYVVAAVITAVLFLASLLTHELAHAVVAPHKWCRGAEHHAPVARRRCPVPS
ncbi:MAG: hypothetical protein ACRDPJ_07445 [Nocardioidaceae bacterium]